MKGNSVYRLGDFGWAACDGPAGHLYTHAGPVVEAETADRCTGGPRLAWEST